jgi:hypothetical protein
MYFTDKLNSQALAHTSVYKPPPMHPSLVHLNAPAFQDLSCSPASSRPQWVMLARGQPTSLGAASPGVVLGRA